jgi:hypothetical protein
MTIVASPTISVDVCIDEAGAVTALLWDGTRTNGPVISMTTLGGNNFALFSIDASTLFSSWTTVTVNINGTVSEDGTQLTVLVTGTAFDGYNTAAVNANFTIARNDATVCTA